MNGLSHYVGVQGDILRRPLGLKIELESPTKTHSGSSRRFVTPWLSRAALLVSNRIERASPQLGCRESYL
jgi:hypothetical protein